MSQWLTFSSVPKEEMHISVPRGLVGEFRKLSKSMGHQPNVLMTYLICKALSKDPTIYALFPFNEAISADDA